MLKIFITIATLMSLPLPASAEIYKCRLPDGKTEISNSPCSVGSNTITTRPDERVSEASRRQAEREVERMRQFVEKREASQRAEEAAAREERAASQQQRNNASRPPPAAPPRQYGSAEECLRNVEPMALEASQRAQMEADCHNIAPPPQNVYVPVGIPAYPQPTHTHQPPIQAPMPKSEPPPAAPKIVMPPQK